MTARAAAAVLDHDLTAMMRRYSGLGVLLMLQPRSSGIVAITRIEVDDDLRGQGLARTALKAVCAWADEGKHTLGIAPSATRGADAEPLALFCGDLGFKPNPESESQQASPMHDSMIRYPGGGETP